MKTVVLYAVLLSAAMVGSYVSWTADDSATPDTHAVPVYRATTGDVTGLVFTSEDVDVTLERRSDDRGEYAWLSVTERRKTLLPPEPTPAVDPADEAGPADPDAPDEPGEPEEEVPAEERFEIEVIETAFTGSDKALDLLADFEPLQAKRSLDASLASTSAFGFDEPSGTVVVKRNGKEETIVVGGSTYGSKDRYVKHDSDLFLLDDNKIRPLQFATTRLRERRPQPWLSNDVETVAITFEGKAASFEQKNRDDRAKAFWVRGGEDAEDDAAGTLIDKILRLKVSNQPLEPRGDLTPLAAVTLTQGDEVWTLSLASDGTEDGRFLTSDFLRGTVPVLAATADEILDDLSELLAN